MRPMDRYDLNIIIEKLDRNLVTVASMRTWVTQYHGATLTARTKEKFIRELCDLYRTQGIKGAC